MQRQNNRVQNKTSPYVTSLSVIFCDLFSLLFRGWNVALIVLCHFITYVSPSEMYAMEYLLYHLRPYGVDSMVRFKEASLRFKANQSVIANSKWSMLKVPSLSSENDERLITIKTMKSQTKKEKAATTTTTIVTPCGEWQE